jgi:hypothetical protein
MNVQLSVMRYCSKSTGAAYMKKNSQNIWYRPWTKICFHILRVMRDSSRP